MRNVSVSSGFEVVILSVASTPTPAPRTRSAASRPGRCALRRWTWRPRLAAIAIPRTSAARPRRWPRAITASNSGLRTASPKWSRTKSTALRPARSKRERAEAPHERRRPLPDAGTGCPARTTGPSRGRCQRSSGSWTSPATAVTPGQLPGHPVGAAGRGGGAGRAFDAGSARRERRPERRRGEQAGASDSRRTERAAQAKRTAPTVRRARHEAPSRRGPSRRETATVP